MAESRPAAPANTMENDRDAHRRLPSQQQRRRRPRGQRIARDAGGRRRPRGVQDVDWDTQDGHYRVRLYGHWLVVPDDAVVTEPNRFGPTVVWPYNDRYGSTRIRCFIPGAGT